MAIRKRTLPSGKAVWQVDYRDQAGKRRSRQFGRRRDADAYLTKISAEVAFGIHVHDRDAVTIDRAYDLLMVTLAEEGAARSTRENYKTYYKLHVSPFVGSRLVTKFHPADVANFLTRLKVEGRSEDTRRRARIALGAVFDEAIRHRLTYMNPVRSLRSRRKVRRIQIREVGQRVLIPEREVVRAMLGTAARTDRLWLYACRRDAEGRSITSAIEEHPAKHPRKTLRAFRDRHGIQEVKIFRPAPWLHPMLAALAFAGLRIGEARGLSWDHLLGEALEVRTAVDRFNERDAVKTAAALRRVPIGPFLANTLAEWKRTLDDARRARRKRKPATLEAIRAYDLVFPSHDGTPLTYSNVVNRQIGPLQIVLGITAENGSPRYTPHSFRHFAVSLWIDEGAEPKQVAEWAGHESPAFTMSVYAHLFAKRRSDRTAAVAGERSVLGTDADATRAQHGVEEPAKVAYLLRA